MNLSVVDRDLFKDSLMLIFKLKRNPYYNLFGTT